MKGSDLLSLAIGAVVLYVLYEWMQGAKAASGAVTNTLQSAPVGGSSQVVPLGVFTSSGGPMAL